MAVPNAGSVPADSGEHLREHHRDDPAFGRVFCIMIIEKGSTRGASIFPEVGARFHLQPVLGGTAAVPNSVPAKPRPGLTRACTISRSWSGIAVPTRWRLSNTWSTTCAKVNTRRPSQAWLKDVQTKYPAYVAFGRDVDLDREKGKTDLLKVGAVIKRELMVAAALSGVEIGGIGPCYRGPSFSSPNQITGFEPAARCRLERPEFLEPRSDIFPGPDALSPAPSLKNKTPRHTNIPAPETRSVAPSIERAPGAKPKTMQRCTHCTNPPCWLVHDRS